MKYFKKIIFLGIIIVLLTPVFTFGKEKSQMKLLMDILETTQASFEEGEISIYGVLLDEFIGEKEMFKVLEALKEELEIEGGPKVIEKIEEETPQEGSYLLEFKEQKNLRQLLVQGFDKRGYLVTVNLASYANGKNRLGETSLYINLSNNEHFSKNNDIILKVENFFDKFSKPINVTSCILGTINGNIDMYEKEQEILGAAEKIKGKVIEEYKDENLISLSIYTPLIKEYIYTGNNKMNLNISMRYNEYENKTNIIIGTPIITSGY